jgi:hypothetical protein
MVERIVTRRGETKLDDSLERRLNSYALAATAAGIGLVALAQPADARIIYRKAHISMVANGTYFLDFLPPPLEEGVFKFQLKNSPGTKYAGYGAILAVNGSVVAYKPGGGSVICPASRTVTGSGKTYYGSALKMGAPINAKAKFRHNGVLEKWCSNKTTSPSYKGPWKNQTELYLGLRFKDLKNLDHYGWVRLNVSVDSKRIIGLITGYAYETIPNKGVYAGQQKIEKVYDASKPQSASLGALAAGANGLLISRPNPQVESGSR